MMYTVKLIDKKIAKELVIKNHYSHKWTSCRYAIGLIYDKEVVGVAVYGFPIGRRVIKSISYLLSNDDVLELTRLWLRDEEPRNTESWFLGQTFKWLRRNTTILVLISYSDPMAGHVGIIYQATNWLYQGNNMMLVKGYLHRVNGEWLHPRTCVAKYGTIKRDKLLEIDTDYTRKPLKKKHRYIMILRKRDRKVILDNLKHPILSYPKSLANSDW